MGSGLTEATSMQIEQRLFGSSGSASTSSDHGSATELSTQNRAASKSDSSGTGDVVVRLDRARFGYARGEKVVSDISDGDGLNLSIRDSPSGSLTIVVGPVGGGKSTFLKGLAGEAPLVNGQMFIRYPTMSICEQTTWLANASIRENIIGESPPDDEEWYQAVVKACALEPDLARLPQGDSTIVGSKGIRLSGGQKQRIVSLPISTMSYQTSWNTNNSVKAIARSVYSRNKVACFDDVLSGLDNNTNKAVFDGVFGSRGLLRRIGCTAFLATNSGMPSKTTNRLGSG